LWVATGGHPGGSAILALLATWALAMGMQSAAVRLLDVGGVFTTAATATFVFLFDSFAGHPLTGEERRRLLGVLASLVIGATSGGLMLIHASAYAPLLPFVITIGVVAMAAKAFGNRDEHRPLFLGKQARKILTRQSNQMGGSISSAPLSLSAIFADTSLARVCP
jgi:uncharacterized membrane protein YoaK (UPF0700 family)